MQHPHSYIPTEAYSLHKTTDNKEVKIKMAKWTSPLFSDIRNAIGKTAVFSSWKGRGYFREYAIPTNPNTNPQKAHRAIMKELVARWQALAGTAEKKALWSAIATPLMISGFNVYVKYGRKSTVKATVGVAATELKITYTCGVPLDKAYFYLYATVAETWTKNAAVPALSGVDFVLTAPVAATEYTVYIGHSDGEMDPVDGTAAATCWYPNEETGVAAPATATSGA